MKVLVLGHKGMLGHMVHKYLLEKEKESMLDSILEVRTINLRWPSREFKKKLLDFDGNFVVNCIGAIHQRTDDFDVNTELPIWLDKNLDNCGVIHPGTDCEMDDDFYGISKKIASDYLVNHGVNTKIIKFFVFVHAHFLDHFWLHVGFHFGTI